MRYVSEVTSLYDAECAQNARVVSSVSSMSKRDTKSTVTTVCSVSIARSVGNEDGGKIQSLRSRFTVRFERLRSYIFCQSRVNFIHNLHCLPNVDSVRNRCSRRGVHSALSLYSIRGKRGVIKTYAEK